MQRRTLLRIRALAAAMREEAPKEQQDRRAYISKEYMADCAGFYRHSREAGGGQGSAQRRDMGGNKFSRLQGFLPSARGLEPCRGKPKRWVCVIAHIS